VRNSHMKMVQTPIKQYFVIENYMFHRRFLCSIKILLNSQSISICGEA
jgi:hypothetical protein